LAFEGKHASKVPAASQLPLTIPTAIDCWSLGVCLGMLLTGQFIFETFAAIVSCLGPLTDKEWPGCTSLPGYKTIKVAQLSDKFNGYDTHVLNFFSSAKHVKYPKPIEDSGLDLISMFLKWPPKGRCTVQQSLDHSFFRDIRDVDGMLHGCSHEQLGQLVKDSIQNGVPVSSFDLVPKTTPASSRGLTQTDLDVRRDEAVGSEHALELQEMDESLCACRGNCRRVACKQAANYMHRWRKLTNEVGEKAQRQICKQPRM
jgi:serine/threonine protein kinase